MTYLSIIVPFRKGRRFLKDCLDSIYEQNLDDYEIILILNGCNENIDDLIGSTVIVKSFEEEMNVGKARNIGLDMANGEYVYFIDSDDYLVGDSLSKLVEKSKSTDAEVIVGEKVQTYYIKDRFHEEDFNPLKSDNAAKFFVSPNSHPLEVLSVLHAVIRMDTIGDLRFKENKRYFSDYDFICELIKNVKSTIGVENAIYAKRISDDIINLKSLNQEIGEDLLLAYIDEYKAARDLISNSSFRDEMANKLFDYYCNEFSHEFLLNPNNKWREKYFDAMASISGDFKSRSFIMNREIKALQEKKKATITKTLKLRVNRKRALNLIKEPWKAHIMTYYKFFYKRPVKDNKIIFESFSGDFYSDNPKYIYEYLYEHYRDDYEFVWVINDKSKKIRGNPKKVKRFSLEYYNEISTCKYLVTNIRQAGRFVKKDSQILVSTWHGTPLKRLGLDTGNVYLTNPRTKETYIKDSNEWDYFISPNRYSSEILKRAFGYEGEMLETGYPRNDILHNYTLDNVLRVKNALKLPLDKKILLYAPTFRDDDSYDVGKVKFKLKLELDKLKESLNEEYIILVRNHYLITDSDIVDYEGFAFDVSKYEDIAELYLISDILITDYSSVFFDFANLKRPILFYTYDLERYESELRGFYIDIRTEVPGPLLETTEEVIDAILNIDEVIDKYGEKYSDFYDKFCYLEDGNATKRIVEEIWKKSSNR